ncbi:MAG: response regulator [bacterium]
MKVLIVDDEQEILDALDTYLTMQGYEVETCASSTVAGERIKESSYSIIMLDINMPKISGIELLEDIKDVEPSCEVIMITGFNSLDKTLDARDRGASEYLLKPLDMQNVREVVEAAGDRVQRWQNALGDALKDSARRRRAKS